MKIIGITGSIASGKSFVLEQLKKKYKTFSADEIVKKIYKNDLFIKKKIYDLFPKKLHSNSIKFLITNEILKNYSFLQKIEKIIHPKIRIEIINFINKNKKKEIIFLDIPLLIENKLNKFFYKIILIKCNKSLRKKRFIKKGGKGNLFDYFNSKQLTLKKKKQYADFIIDNSDDKNLTKKQLKKIIIKILND
jgi:dephospho-CoA kinase